MIDISDDLPEPRPPFATTLSTSLSFVTFHNGWKCLGSKSDKLIDIVIKRNNSVDIHILYISE
ncbi:ORF092 [Staphylococcus phage 92]|uniref:ORF090 n=2 Tax=Phietavirus TaxID=1623298 RepID=Q4ZAQ6_9CAUD|nr:ORF090 [Staphylococcus phage 88]AAX91995.1 ORF092 [Staphylococcus phage 92]